MATATYPSAAGNTAKTEAATFIPEIWSDEIIAAYQKNLKMAPLVKKLAMSGKKGDKIHIPKPTRGDANAKAADTAVTIIANTEGELTVDIDRHFEYSRLIEDIVEVQALSQASVSSTLKMLAMLWLPASTMTFTQLRLVLATVLRLSARPTLVLATKTVAASLTTVVQLSLSILMIRSCLLTYLTMRSSVA